MALDPTKIYHEPRLQLEELFHTPDGVMEAQLSLDLSHLDFFGEKPLQEPVVVTAKVENRGGAVLLQGEIKTPVTRPCDRCNTMVSLEKVVLLDSLLANTLEDEEHDEIILLEGYCLPLDEVATTAFILDMDTKTLCQDQCQGLCTSCGVNLNEADCTCQKVNDSPFAVLASLFDDD